MELIIEFIRRTAWAFALGTTLYFAGWDYKNWRLYVAGIFIIILESLGR